MKPEIHIEIVSDVVCPWCYIGKRRLERAIDLVKDKIEVHVSYSPFELNPDIPASGIPQKEYLISKFGGEERYQQITKQVTTTAAGEGLHFDFEHQLVSPNTRQAHRVLWLAAQTGHQAQLKEAYLKAYFEEGKDLSKTDNLIKIATHAGMNASRVAQLLNSDEGLAEVIALEQRNQQRGIRGVPFYVVNNQYGISGAQPTEYFVEALTSISSKS
ncbi:MAG TPA: DsbA family oxidoreductase [Cyclobacteriaceae bacterium]|nr:DsbA family oxidoreductase [Cyclobacteriaceae bacterium]